MSASFYDLLKYAKTGIAAPDMTAYDKMRAVSMAGGGTIKTLTDVPPLSFKANGSPLISWSMLGNGQQTGTPTPDAPIMPQFVGVRTENLFDYTRTDGITDNYYINQQGQTVASANYYISYAINVKPNAKYVWRFNAEAKNALHTAPSVAFYDNGGELLGAASHAPNVKFFSFTTPSDCTSIKCSVYKRIEAPSEAMLNLGTTALPYETYGWAEKITCAEQTVPVYLGQTQTVRRIKKMVLDGTEDYVSGSGNAPFILRLPDIVQQQDRDAVLFMCTHYQAVPNSASWSQYSSIVSWSFSGSTNTLALVFRDTSCADLNAFKAYLAAQYAAGTPVTVWYVLAEPETAIVNEPLAKIGVYADELHSTDAAVTIPTVKGDNTLTVDTDLQPSEMTITYKG